MKTLILVTLTLFSSFSFASTIEREFEVVVRNEKDLPAIEPAVLTDLVSDQTFDGTYFKIVRGKSDEAISFNAAPELVFRAATTYYHLTKARNYFVQKLQSEYVASIPKMVIRIDHTNQFSELGHFANDNLEPQFNNALTIPAGRGLESRGVRPWGMEIWFRPLKKIHIRDLKVNNSQTQEFKVLLHGFRNQIHMQSLQRFLIMGVLAFTEDGQKVDVESVVRTVGSSLIIEAGYRYIDPITKAFSRKWFWLDTALVPEIIYHEYSHAALSDHLVLSHSTSIIEGMADFFAGQIAESPLLAANIKQYNTYNGKNATKKQNYVLQFETTDYANTDFVFGILWSMKSIVGEKNADQFMYEMRKRLTTNSSIRGELIDGLLGACEASCENPFRDKLRILKSLNAKGI